MVKNNLRKLREEKGLTQKDLCKLIAEKGYVIERSTYSKYETGDRSIPCDFLIIISRFYETSTDNILGIV